MGESRSSRCQPGRACPTESKADGSAHTSALVCHCSRVQCCKFAWSELCAVVDKLFLVSELVCLMFVTGEQRQTILSPPGRKASHQT